MDQLTAALIVATFALLISTFYFAIRKNIEIREIPTIDPEIENDLAKCKHTLRSIAYAAKTIKEARKLAEDALPEENE